MDIPQIRRLKTKLLLLMEMHEEMGGGKEEKMSVLVKGMEMPKSCDKCPIMVFEDTNCAPELFCGCPIVFKAHPQGVGHRPDYCPLIEIPPHGDLIDKQALFNGEFNLYSWSEIDEAPTIIPAEEDE